jgi:phosphotriesterase-related protein
MNRRAFLQSTACAASCALLGANATDAPDQVMTVTGLIPAADLGRTLVHEHVAVDFIGAARTSPDRYDSQRAFDLARPHFERLRRDGVKTLVECTPRFIGRNPALLVRLSRDTGLQILTNTGWYAAVQHRFLPPEAQSESIDQIAARWLREWTEGLDGTGVRPGFLKLGTGSGPLPPVDAKLVRAAARVHRTTGLPVAIHTGDGAAALDELKLLREEGVRPEALIWVHAQNDPGPIQIEAARLGAWISLDGYSLSGPNVLRYPAMVVAHREAGTLNRVLLSHDDGWAVDGDAPSGNKLTLFGNGNPIPYSSLFSQLIPDLRARGFSDADLQQVLVVNPRSALTLRPRLLS